MPTLVGLGPLTSIRHGGAEIWVWVTDSPGLNITIDSADGCEASSIDLDLPDTIRLVRVIEAWLRSLR